MTTVARSTASSSLANSALANTPLANAAKGLDACVHCGFCLQACPTYVNLEDENDSPRGRLVLMRRMLDGEIALNDADAGVHFDRCLGCRACETACPSGVPYGELLEATRATMAPVRGIPIVARMVLALFKRTALLRVVLFGARVFRATGLPMVLARVLPERLAFPMAMLASTAPVRLTSTGFRPTKDASRQTNVASSQFEQPSHELSVSRLPSPVSSLPSPAVPLPSPVSSLPSQPVTLLTGCVMSGLLQHVNAATARTLTHNGYSCHDTGNQHCCGALHAHAGDLESARELARRNIIAFEARPDALIAINSAGCGAMVKQYAHLLHDDAEWSERAKAVSARARDATELLAAAGPRLGASLPWRVTHDPPCHQMHAQRVVAQPRAVLAAIPSLDLVALEDADQCCGSAGIYNLVEPDTSNAVLAPKLARIAATNAQLVATGNPGCMMQIGAGLLRSGSSARVVHPIQLLDASYAQQ